jgi:hypothetical protein
MSNKGNSTPITRRGVKSGRAEAKMTERKTRVQVPGGAFLDAVEVSVESSSEKWSEYTLQDGSQIRIKQALIEVARVIDQYDAEGNPLYHVKAQPILTIISAPERLKKKPTK